MATRLHRSRGTRANSGATPGRQRDGSGLRPPLLPPGRPRSTESSEVTMDFKCTRSDIKWPLFDIHGRRVARTGHPRFANVATRHLCCHRARHPGSRDPAHARRIPHNCETAVPAEVPENLIGFVVSACPGIRLLIKFVRVVGRFRLSSGASLEAPSPYS